MMYQIVQTFLFLATVTGIAILIFAVLSFTDRPR